MSIRKSSRSRTLTSKVRENSVTSEPTNKTLARKSSNGHDENVSLKKRKLKQHTPPEETNSDKIDPVEKLLSLTNVNNDILNLDEDEEDKTNTNTNNVNQFREIKSLNFSKILNDNIRSYYANYRKSPLEVYNDHSSFALLNHKSNSTGEELVSSPNPSPSTPTFTHNPNVPFFKNVNFGAKSNSGDSYTFDDYFSYGEDAPSTSISSSNTTPSTASDVSESPSSGFAQLNNKMRFHYRQHHNNLNLSDSSSCSSSAFSYQSSSHPVHMSTPSDSHDIFKILNKRSILTGKASEMVSTGTFLINDFFL